MLASNPNFCLFGCVCVCIRGEDEGKFSSLSIQSLNKSYGRGLRNWAKAGGGRGDGGEGEDGRGSGGGRKKERVEGREKVDGEEEVEGRGRKWKEEEKVEREEKVEGEGEEKSISTPRPSSHG